MKFSVKAKVLIDFDHFSAAFPKPSFPHTPERPFHTHWNAHSTVPVTHVPQAMERAFCISQTQPQTKTQVNTNKTSLFTICKYFTNKSIDFIKRL